MILVHPKKTLARFLYESMEFQHSYKSALALKELEEIRGMRTQYPLPYASTKILA